MPYQSTKRYGHELGLSACFRQWRAESHCRLLHGYALAFEFVFEANTLNACNWVQDFGSLGELKRHLQYYFDHKLCVAEDDPKKDYLCAMAGLGLADAIVLPAVGCEAFAKLAYDLAVGVVSQQNQNYADAYNRSRLAGEPHIWPSQVQRVRVVSCKVSEHNANSAIYIGEQNEPE